MTRSRTVFHDTHEDRLIRGLVVTLFRTACRAVCLILLATACFFGCARSAHHDQEGGSAGTIVFKHGAIPGRSDVLRRLLDIFERENPGIAVRDEALPSSTDEQHQFYAINLEARSADFDVLGVDVIWVPEFARAGWLRDITKLMPPSEATDFFPGPVEAVTYRGRVFAIPWYIDAGILFYRSDLLAKYHLSVPQTWQDLVSEARHISEHEPSLYGFIWQGKQYEGLVCNILEYIWSNGGELLLPTEGVAPRASPVEGATHAPIIASGENREALRFVKDLIFAAKASPPFVTTATEETTRQIFGSGKAIFMRNWPYAWNIFQREGSAVKGRVGVAQLPSFPGHTPASTLGGWQLGVNPYSKRPEAAERLVAFLTSARVQKELAFSVGYQPSRRSVYRDAEFRKRLPHVANLYPIFMNARPRPVTPYYMMITQVLQSEFSAAISGIRTVDKALESAERQISHILGVEG